MCETADTEATAKKKNPAKLNVLRGSADAFESLRDLKITRPGLKRLPENAGEMALSENGVPTSGPICSDSETVANLRQQSLDDLQRA